jgi:predicted RecA/RadA family phage recombinase
VEPKLELISGTFGRGEGRYHEGVFALPNRERRSIASVARIEVDTSLEGTAASARRSRTRSTLA